ncbi:hypothetical protein BGX33_009640 [Mortierella sp. NVP41]|nr:hypothetical protein BGX33_009640 [Mortierella sp. NVP41]
MDTATTKNPFDIPELRHRLSLFVTVKNALSCARVSKSWVYDFVAAVWFTVHFDVHPRFVDLASEIITKHCHLIRIVKNVKSLLHVRSIANTGVNRLRELRMNTAASAMQHVYGHEIVSRNSARLENPDTLSTSIPANKRNSTVHYLSASALIPFPCSTSKATTSKLKVLKLSSRSSTEMLLSLLGAQDPLSLWVIGTLSVVLFLEFENFVDLELRRDVHHSFCTNIATKVLEIDFPPHHTSLETITAILLDQATWKSVTIFKVRNDFNCEAEEIVPVPDHLQVSGQLLQLIPRGFSLLETLDFHGLDTKKKIRKAIALWRAGCWRRWQGSGKATVVLVETKEKTRRKKRCSIEARVARHLLKFEKLWWIWLGYKTLSPV